MDFVKKVGGGNMAGGLDREGGEIGGEDWSGRGGCGMAGGLKRRGVSAGCGGEGDGLGRVVDSEEVSPSEGIANAADFDVLLVTSHL